MIDPLEPLLADGVIDEIVSRLKSGKEADVWLVRHGDELVAAKVYKARHERSFKNNAAYKEGRQVRNSRTQRAMDRGSRFGQAAAEDAWKAKESDALHRLHEAGLRVPRPVLFYEGVLLMEVVRDADGRPAPRLIDAPIAPEQAAGLYADVRQVAVGMLACDLIHGDLSPYNVLLGAAGPVVIDFPQVVGAAHNSQAETFFLRDLQNIHRFFAALDPALAASEGDGREIWRAHVRRELTASFVPTGRAPPPPPEPRQQRPRGDAPRAQPTPPQRGRTPAPAHPPGPANPPGHPHQRPPSPQPIRAAHPTPSNRPAQSAQPNRPAQSAQPNRPALPAQPNQSARPAQPSQPRPNLRGQPSAGTTPPSGHGRPTGPRTHGGAAAPGAPRAGRDPERPPRQRDQRRGHATPMPEVIRVARPPHGAPAAVGAPPRGPRSPPMAAPARQAERPDGNAPGSAGGRRRRRRRHGSGT